MEGFIVSARKYRPATFDAVVGQSHVTDTLKNAIKMGQLAHAFLFSGPRGVGKTTCARILAKAINCLNPAEDGEPCNECTSCSSFNEGRSLNIHELDAASNNSVEDIRKIIEQVRYVPTSGKKSVFIIDEVHMLSQAAFNAFLKTLEEPPPHAIFILATTEKHKILPTILSRVQKFDFRRIKVNRIADHLKGISEQETVTFEYEALQLIGLKADGALRDALSIFDQIVSFSGGNVTYKVVVENLNVLDYDYYFKAVDGMMAQDYEGLLLMLNEIIDLGFEARDFMVGLTEHFRNLMVARTPKTLGLLETSDNIKKRYKEQVAAVPPSLLLNAFNLCSEAEQKLRNSANPRLHIELNLMKLAYLQSAIRLVADEKKKVPTESTARNEKIASPGVIAAEVPQAETPETKSETETAPEEEGLSASETMRKRQGGPGTVIKGAFSIPKSLDDIDLSSGKAEEKEEDESEFIQYDTSVNIDAGQFDAAMDELIAQLNEERKIIVASMLGKKDYRLDHNKWVQNVPTDVARKQLEQERDIVFFLREKIAVPNLILEIEIVEQAPNPDDTRPYTNDEKLELLLEKNPDLRLLMKKFDTLMNY